MDGNYDTKVAFLKKKIDAKILVNFSHTKPEFADFIINYDLVGPDLLILT